MDQIRALEDWYTSQCDGDWEHSWGVKIGTIDNPGWRVEINLLGTELEDQPFTRVEVEQTENDWVHIWVKENVFHGTGGPQNLSEILETFLRWRLADKRHST